MPKKPIKIIRRSEARRAKALASGRVIRIKNITANAEPVELFGEISDFSDKFASSFNSQQVYGRMDPIQTFQGTQREISVSMIIKPQSATDARNLAADLGRLAKMCYPNYSESSKTNVKTLAAGPLWRVLFANMVSKNPDGDTGVSNSWKDGLLCSHAGVSYSFGSSFGQGDHVRIPVGGAGLGTEHGSSAFPGDVIVSLSFVVLHEDDLGWNVDGIWMGQEKYPYGFDSTSARTGTGTSQNESSYALSNSGIGGDQTAGLDTNWETVASKDDEILS